MKTKIIKNVLNGIPAGITIGYLITLGISVIMGKGTFFIGSPEIIQKFGNEVNVAVFQTLLWTFMGMTFSLASFIYDMDEWSIGRQTITHFLLTIVGTFPVAYFGHWINVSVGSLLTYVMIYAMVYFIIWIVRYFIWRHIIKNLNKKVENM